MLFFKRSIPLATTAVRLSWKRPAMDNATCDLGDGFVFAYDIQVTAHGLWWFLMQNHRRTIEIELSKVLGCELR